MEIFGCDEALESRLLSQPYELTYAYRSNSRSFSFARIKKVYVLYLGLVMKNSWAIIIDKIFSLVQDMYVRIKTIKFCWDKVIKNINWLKASYETIIASLSSLSPVSLASLSVIFSRINLTNILSVETMLEHSVLRPIHHREINLIDSI